MICKKNWRDFNKKLIVITAFVLLGTLVNSAMAAKRSPEVTLSAGPIYDLRTCDVANHTDQTIEVFMNICRALKDNSAPIECFDFSPGGNGDPAPVAGFIAPGHYQSALAFKHDPTYSYSCELTYKGDPGDMTGMMCGLTQSNLVGDPQFYACFPLQPR